MSLFATELSRTVCVDPALGILPMISLAGAAIGNTARARMSADYAAPAVVWSAVLARSGERKSPALRAVMRPLYEAQKLASRQHDEAIADHRDQLARWKAQPKPERGDPPADPPPFPHMFLSDVTAEAIAQRLHEQPRGLPVVLDELAALFGGMNQYKKGGNDRESYLAFYDAGAAKIDRKTSNPPTIFIPRAFVAVTGMVQPGVLARCLGAAEYDSGLAARFLLAAPPPRQATWSQKPMSEAARDGWGQLIDTLLAQALPPDPALIPPTEAAMSIWQGAHDRLEAERYREPDDRVRAARSKLIGLVPRLSLIFQMVSAATGEQHAMVRVIDHLSMSRAVAVVEWATRETKRVYALLAEVEADRLAGGADDDESIIRLIEDRGGQITTRELMRNCRPFRSSAGKAEAYLSGMERDGLGKWEWQRTGGRPTRVFRLHPVRALGGDKSPPQEGGDGDKTPDPSAPGAFVSVTTVTGDEDEKGAEGGPKDA